MSRASRTSRLGARSSLREIPSRSPHYLNHHSLHTTSTITHKSDSRLPQPSLTTGSMLLHTTSTITTTPHYLNHHSQVLLHTTSTITSKSSPHYLDHRSRSILLQPSLTAPRHLNRHSRVCLHTTSTITHSYGLMAS